MSSTLGRARTPRFFPPRVLTCIATLVGLLAASVLPAQPFDADDVDFEAAGLPEGADWSRETGTLRWRPRSADAGSHSIVITAVDVWGATDSVQLTIDVVLSEAREVAGRAEGR